MRKYTLFISVVVHAAAVLALVVAPLLAVGALPMIHHRTVWMPVQVAAPPAFGRSSSRPPSARATAPAPAPVTPTVAPPTIDPESESPAPAVDAGVPGVPGLVGDGDPGIGNPGPGVPWGTVGGDPKSLLLVPPTPPVPQPTILRAGGRISAPRKIVHVTPVYPPLALAARVEGDVILEALIAEDGRVQTVRLLRSVPLLDQAAIAAVRQWRFTTSTLNDQPISILMNVTVKFSLR